MSIDSPTPTPKTTEHTRTRTPRGRSPTRPDAFGRPFVCRFPVAAAASRSVGHTCDGLGIYVLFYYVYQRTQWTGIPSEDPAVIISLSSPVLFGRAYIAICAAATSRVSCTPYVFSYIISLRDSSTHDNKIFYVTSYTSTYDNNIIEQ